MEEKLYCVRIEDFSANGEIMNEFLSAQEFFFGTWEDKENPRLVHTVYSPDEAEGKDNFERIKSLLGLWREYGAEIGEPKYFELEKTDWSEAWKKYFNIIHVTPRLVVRPGWLDYEAKPGQNVIRIDPGMSFGTGQHATTLFCLRTIDKLADCRDEVKDVLDAGCGSGILSIAAMLSGFESVEAFDNDPDCVRIAAENAQINNVALNVFEADAGVYPGKKGGYDLVLANILGHLLIAFRSNIASWVRPGKYLALAGILSTEFDRVSAAFTALGFTELERSTEKEWTGGLFRKNS